MLSSILAQRGFWIACLCLVVVTVSNGMINSGLSVYDEALVARFDVTIAALKLRDSISFMGSTFFIVMAGFWVDRVGPKPFLIAGLAILSAVYYLYPMVDRLWHIYLLHGALALVLACAGNMTAIVTAARWFPEQRGLAVGMAVAGTSMGGMILPPLATELISRYGWQTAMQFESLIPLVVLLFVALLLPKGLPAAVEVALAEARTLTYLSILRSAVFVRITLAASLTYYAALSIFSHGFLYFRSLGLSASDAAWQLSILALSALAGKLVTGAVSDRLEFDYFFRVQMCVLVSGISCLAGSPSYALVGCVIAGYGWGGLHALYNIVLIRLFGLDMAGRVNGTVSVAEAVGGSVGIAATGYFATVYSYSVGLVVATALSLIALFLIWFTPTRSDQIQTEA